MQSLRDQGKVRFWGMTAVGETPALLRVIESGVLQTLQTVYNLVNPSAGNDVPDGFDMPNYRSLIDRAAASGMGALVIRGAGCGSPQRRRDPPPRRRAHGGPHRLGSGLPAGPIQGEPIWFPSERRLCRQPGGSVHPVRLGAGQGSSTVLVGYSSLEHLEQAVEYAGKGSLPGDALAKLPEVWAGFVG